MKILLLSLCAVAIFAVNAAQAQEFAADAIAHNAKGQVAKTKVYVEREWVRVEPLGAPSYEILNTTDGTGFFVVPGKKVIVQQTPEVAKQSISPYKVPGDLCVSISTSDNTVVCKKLGSETTNGHTVEKWQLMQTVNKKAKSTLVWVDRSLRAVVKSQSDLGGFEMTNFRFGKQLPNLFELPAGFKRTQMNSITFTRMK